MTVENPQHTLVGKTATVHWNKAFSKTINRDGFDISDWKDETILDVRKFGDGEEYVIVSNHPFTWVNVKRLTITAI